MKLDSVVVVGGVNCDITASVTGILTPGTSNPGRVGLSPGGVGRNIAHNMALLGVPVALVGRAGRDALSEWVLAETAAAGVDVAAVERADDGAPGLCVSLLSDGELEAAVADMAEIESLTPETAVSLLASVEQRTRPVALVVDLNLSIRTVQAVIGWANDREVPVIVETVSVAKAQRLLGITGRIAIVTPNVAEAAVLREGAARLPDIDWWVVTRGRLGAGLWRSASAGGAAGTEETACRLLRARPVVTRNANGAGDSFVAGLVAALIAGFDVPDAARWGMAAGAITAASEGSVAASLSRDAVIRAAAELPIAGEE